MVWYGMVWYDMVWYGMVCMYVCMSFILKLTCWLFGSGLELCLTGYPLSVRSEEVHLGVGWALRVGAFHVMSLLLVILWACGLRVSFIESCGKV